MLGMAKFLSKTLKPTEEGYLLADPSSSPEQYHNGTTYQTKGCAFDQGMIWESFHDVLKAADILKEESPFLRTIKRADWQTGCHPNWRIGADKGIS